MICSNMNPGQSGEKPGSCMAGQGSLPACGPFATPYVVSQGPNPEKYTKERALEQGTLYPDLNLPFHLKVNPGRVADTPLNQIRALDFAIQELGLYLDTHPYDAEAFALFQEYVTMAKTAKASYVEQHGPLVQTDAARDGSYTWGNGPWPWQYCEEEG